MYIADNYFFTQLFCSRLFLKTAITHNIHLSILIQRRINAIKTINAIGFQTNEMDLAEPAGRVSPAIAEADDASKYNSTNDHNEYIVEAADNINELDDHDVSMEPVEPATAMSDATKFLPIKHASDSLCNDSGNHSISVETLKQGPTGIAFEGAAGICRGMEMHTVRRVTLALSRFLPAIYDQRGELI